VVDAGPGGGAVAYWLVGGFIERLSSSAAESCQAFIRDDRVVSA
jgi:hypothetical protein